MLEQSVVGGCKFHGQLGRSERFDLPDKIIAMQAAR
jgi:hypothetical protein